MNKSELINKTAEAVNFTKKDTEIILNALIAEITKAVARGEKVKLVGFGAFETRRRETRAARNPNTGERIVIPAYTAPVFKAGQTFKDSVNKGKNLK